MIYDCNRYFLFKKSNNSKATNFLHYLVNQFELKKWNMCQKKIFNLHFQWLPPSFQNFRIMLFVVFPISIELTHENIIYAYFILIYVPVFWKFVLILLRQMQSLWLKQNYQVTEGIGFAGLKSNSQFFHTQKVDQINRVCARKLGVSWRT